MARPSIARRVRSLFARRPPPVSPDGARADVSDRDRAILERSLPYTMTGEARLLALIDSVRYCVRREIPGALVECGVWRGGSVLAMILTLQDLGVDDREIHLFDTFEGMTKPTELDVSPIDPPALQVWREARSRGARAWGELFDPRMSGEEAVRELLLATGYPARRLRLVAGPVEETIPGRAPDRVALLRLDTDWYESTRHELEHLYPRLAEGGVLVIDDYGHWRGCKRAVDEYFASQAPPLLLNRIDYTGRVAVKR